MEPIRVAGFLGANQAQDAQLLPAEIGTQSLNQKPGNGSMRPWHQPQAVANTSTPGRKTIYRFNADVASDTNYWFEWSSIVHVVRGFIADDTSERTYFTGAGAPKVTNNVMGLAGAPYPTTAREHGVPVPLTAPILTQTAAGPGDDENRYYFYTYLTDFSEESAPSPVSAVAAVKPGARLNITNIAAPPAGNYGINRMRIYRSVVGTSGSAEFFMIAEVAVATTTTDNALVASAYANESNGPSGSVGRVWTPPPADLACLTGLWAGMMAGISGMSVRYCEPNKPYAWPAAYETLCNSKPVALGVFQKNLVILTTGTPRIAYGSAPEAMDDTGGGINAACVSVPSVVSFEHGVCWAAPDGLAYIGLNGSPRFLTAGVFEKEQWQALNPTTIISAQYLGFYMGFYDAGGGVLKGFMLDPLAAAGSVYFFDTGFTAVYYDALQEALYGVNGTSIKKWDAGAALMTATFRTKEFRLPLPENPGAAEVIAREYPVTFKLFADGALMFTKIATSREPFNLPSGYEPDVIQLEVSTSAGSLAAFAVAGDIDALNSV